MRGDEQLSAPSLQWRFASSATIALVGVFSKCFLKLANTTKVYGLREFEKLLDERKDPAKRERGLITGEYSYPWLH
jgi:monolysocardiolipin acyltransferase